MDTTIARCTDIGERIALAELFRVKATIAAAEGAADEALAALEHASSVARQQGARGWEMRAATDRAALLAHAVDPTTAR